MSTPAYAKRSRVTDAMADEAADFLFGWPGDKINITGILPDVNKLAARTFDKAQPNTRAELRKWIMSGAANGYGIYFNGNGIKVTLGKDTLKASNKEVDILYAFHVDADVDKSITDPAAFEIAKAEKLESILAASNAPNVIIDSGNGFALFWVLEKPVKVTPANADMLTRINMALRDQFGGDHCQDLCHILRVPGTINYPNEAKRKRNRPVQPTRRITGEHELAVYNLADFMPAVVEIQDDADDTFVIDVPSELDLAERLKDQPDLYKLIKDGAGDQKFGDGTRSDFTYSIACDLRRIGFTDGEIVRVITDPTYAVSAHILDQKQRTPDKQARRVITRMNNDGVTADPPSKIFAEPLPDIPTPAPSKIEFDDLSKVKPVNIDFVWKEHLAIGKMTILAGMGGLGKSLIQYDTTARITRAADWPDGSGKAPQGTVLLLSAEDDLADMMVPRLMGAGADLTRIKRIKMVNEGNGRKRRFNMLTDLDALYRACREFGDVVMAGIDPIGSYLGGDIDTHNDAKLRNALDPISEFAAAAKVAVSAVAHFNKSANIGNAVNKVMGGVGFVNAPRCAYGFFADPDDAALRLLLGLKTNIGKYPMPGLKAHTEMVEVGKDENGEPITAPRIVWDGPTDVDADEVLAAAAANARDASPRMKEAQDFLFRTLTAGERLQEEVMKEAKKAGITEITLRRASHAIGVKSSPSGANKKWLWRLPDIDPASGE